MSSEVAKLRAQIEAVCYSMNLGLSGYAISARHDIIRNKYRQLDTCHQGLKKLVGEEQATEIVCNTYDQIITGSS